ncbi:tetratricopeptide repeat protein [Solwaraspora sp. WMMD1047]|uniref:ATP-binding protein n=1 Tax=Solwaraspora sp. WMMD1047 TaxID=3016102 RepID=UPI00241735D1|nr:tetratricopeptide repeat protein [Solwaraspora sp. WMMD1047]MDG4829823.1 tetratricopeptide repeat protein [Solwaraspora sp. WMMD1047]
MGSDTIGSVARRHRLRLGLTQEELAARTGLSARAISRLEAGRVSQPRLPTVRLLADAFGLRGSERDAFCAMANPATADPAMTDPEPRTERKVPAELPPDAFPFTGRRREIDRLDAVLSGISDQPTALVMSTVTGPPGVGKSALVIHWAHRARVGFPDGQLYLNLRGYHPTRPMPAGDALTALLTGLGVAADEIPVDLAQRTARYRTEVADRRLLLVLDNAATEEQVVPLLPGTASCRVLVTSRDSLPGLVAFYGSHRIELSPLPPSDAAQFLRRFIGPRVDVAPDAARDLAQLCSGLPLALRIAAELAVARPESPLDDLVTELRDRHSRLSMFDRGAQPGGIGAVISWSLRRLAPEAVRAFRLLGLHPGSTFDAYALAALCGVDPGTAREIVGRLARSHLVLVAGRDRYDMHDLLRRYAASLADRGDDPADRPAAALRRLYDFHLAAAAAALDVLYPAESARRPAPPAGSPELRFDDPDAARRWLDHERGLLASAAAARDVDGWADRASWLSDALYRYLDGGHNADALRIHGNARDAAVLRADRAAETRALLGLGAAHLWRGELDEAAGCFRRSLELCQDGVWRARALNSLGVVERRLGRYDSAARVQQEAVALAADNADVTGEARALNNLAVTEHLRGRSRAAADHLDRALALFSQAGDRTGQANALHNLGKVEMLRGRTAAAADRLGRALDLYRRLGNLRGEATTLDCLGVAHTTAGQTDRAADHFEASLTIFGRIGDPAGVASAYNGLGEVARARGRPDVASVQHAAALESAAGSLEQQARAHRGLAVAGRARGDQVDAVEHYKRAADLYRALGAAEADEMLAELAGLGRG